VGVYGLGLLAFELWRLRRPRPMGSRIFPFVATGLPFVPVVPLLLMSPAWSLQGGVFWGEMGEIDGLIFVGGGYFVIVAVSLVAIVVAAGIWAVRHRLLRLHPLGFMILVVGGFIYLILPRNMFATYLADQRLPIALAFMLVACAHLELRHRLVRRGFL